MFDAFKKWSMSGHTFKFVKLTPSEVESLGAATRQFLEAKGEDDEAVMVSERRKSPTEGGEEGRKGESSSRMCSL